jgi:hypothetical protein
MKKTHFILGAIVVGVVVIVILLLMSQNEHITNSSTSDILLFTGARGDFVDPGPIEDECQRKMEQYVQSTEFKNRGFSGCELIESKVGFSEKECPNGSSPQGCSICKLKCE